MAFLQICRRHQAVFESASHSFKSLLTARRFYSSCTLHRYAQNGAVSSGKTCTGKKYVLIFFSILFVNCTCSCVRSIKSINPLHLCHYNYRRHQLPLVKTR